MLGFLEGAGRRQESCSVSYFATSEFCHLCRHGLVAVPAGSAPNVSVEAEVQKSTADPNKKMMTVQGIRVAIH